MFPLRLMLTLIETFPALVEAKIKLFEGLNPGGKLKTITRSLLPGPPLLTNPSI